MRIFVITGSPHKHGTSDLLASEFIRGAREAGHEVERIDAAFAHILPCTGCYHCSADGVCVHKDDMPGVLRTLLDSDMVVLATPLYYFGMSAQMKTLIDRFNAVNSQIQAKRLRAVLLATSWDAKDWTMEALVHHYQTLCRYLNWQDAGMVLGEGCGNLSMAEQTDFPQQAYQLGRSL